MKPRFPVQSDLRLGAGSNHSQALAPMAYNLEHIIKSKAITPAGDQLGSISDRFDDSAPVRMVTPVSCRQAKAKAGLDRVSAGNEDGPNVAGFVQSLAECGHIWRKARAKAPAGRPDHRYRLLLRVHCARWRHRSHHR
jgi:hypothetical protein